MSIEEVTIHCLPRMKHEAETTRQQQETHVSELNKELTEKLLRLHKTFKNPVEADKDIQNQWTVAFGFKNDEPTMNELKMQRR